MTFTVSLLCCPPISSHLQLKLHPTQRRRSPQALYASPLLVQRLRQKYGRIFHFVEKLWNLAHL